MVKSFAFASRCTKRPAPPASWINGQVFETFKQGCQHMNLLEDDEWMQCLADAETNIPSTLRHLFVTVLLFCEPADPLNLFQTNLLALSEDYHFCRRQQGLNDEELESASENDILCGLDDRLKQHVSTTVVSLSSFRSSSPQSAGHG